MDNEKQDGVEWTGVDKANPGDDSAYYVIQHEVSGSPEEPKVVVTTPVTNYFQQRYTTPIKEAENSESERRGPNSRPLTAEEIKDTNDRINASLLGSQRALENLLRDMVFGSGSNPIFTAFPYGNPLDEGFGMDSNYNTRTNKWSRVSPLKKDSPNPTKVEVVITQQLLDQEISTLRERIDAANQGPDIVEGEFSEID